jgi:serine protease Do
MYNPYENNDANKNNDINDTTNETLNQNTEKEETKASENTTYTAPNYGQPSNPYTGQSQSSYPTQTGWQYGNQPNTYTWNGAGQQQSNAPYYTPAQPPKQKKPRDGKKAKKYLLRAVAAVLCCAVVSFGSVGIFAALIQTGVVNVESTGSSKTAAFTLYKNADSGEDASNVVTSDEMTRQQAAQKVIPSVVCIQNYQISTQGFFFNSSGADSDSTGSLAGEGSGIIISEDGYIVTNQHVVDGASKLEVVTSDGASYEATLVGEDTQTDLAVIKIEATGLTAAEFADSGDLQVGDEVMAVGNPGGLQLSSSVTFGYVSALDRPVTNSDTGYTVKCIQTDAAINPGNSGGALVDMNGRVVGINSSKIAATEYEGLGFAIPSDTVQPIVTDLIDYGYVKDRPMLGITGMFLSALQATWNNVPSGFLVDEVSSEQAVKSGLQRNDIITAIDDTQVTSANTIATYIADKKPGDTVTLTVYRYSTGESLEIELVLSENSGLSGQSSNN